MKKSWNPGTISSGAEVNKALLTKTKQTDYLGNKIYEDGELKTEPAIFIVTNVSEHIA